MVAFVFQLSLSSKVDQDNSESDSKIATRKLEVVPYSFATASISSCHNSCAKILFKYEVDETLEIKEEIIQDKEAVTDQEGNNYQSTSCSVYIREADIVANESRMPTQEKQKIQELRSEKKYKCEKCARSYSRKNSLYSHQRYYCGVIPQFRCKFCDRRFKKQHGVNRHIGLVHQKKISKTPILMLKCDKCWRSFTRLDSLNRHELLVHSPAKPQFTCHNCGFKMKSKADLSKHITRKHLK
ncbi:zinc finger protein 676-like [Belonocnema kinseyi]|uniref:zinc finger protein 676-like n=1 Tax=Belonocnema kinseyi TaxID=2817044 RepID=UPI00143DFB30|nr:zinc finger protein 676-like [Belonocnema kinseyi]